MWIGNAKRLTRSLERSVGLLKRRAAAWSQQPGRLGGPVIGFRTAVLPSSDCAANVAANAAADAAAAVASTTTTAAAAAITPPGFTSLVRRRGATVDWWGGGRAEALEQQAAFLAQGTSSSLRIVLNLLKSGQFFDKVTGGIPLLPCCWST